MANQNQKNANHRYLAKIVQKTGNYGGYQQVLMDSIYPNKQDGTPDQYYQGSLIWIDAITGKRYLIKRLAVKNAPAHAQANGAVATLRIDLGNQYEVDELKD